MGRQYKLNVILATDGKELMSREVYHEYSSTFLQEVRGF